MKKILFPFTLVIALVVMAFNGSNNGLPIGSPIPKPTIKMKDVSGKLVSLNDARTANGLLVTFSCNTCPYVIKNQARIKEINEYALNKKVGVIILNSNEAYRDGDDSYNAMKSYASAQGYNWPYVIDSNSELADAFGANRTPECFLFDGTGKLVYHGAIDDSPADESKISRHHLKEAMDEMLLGKEVSVKESKSVGCTIKRKS